MKKTVLITGGAKGIGRQIAIDFAKLGYNVCVNYNTSEKEALILKDEMLSNNVMFEIYKCDITNRDDVDQMIDNIILKMGSIDVVVNNAGICEYKLFTDITNQDLLSMLNISVIGTFNVTQSALKKYMLNKKDGNIINISSIWGMVGASCEVNYSTSKAAIIGMSKALAKELSLSNIRVNVVAPGVIDTDMIANLSENDIISLKDEIPLNRIGKAEDVSSTVTFLASDKAGYITGQVISPNGGFVI